MYWYPLLALFLGVTLPRMGDAGGQELGNVKCNKQLENNGIVTDEKNMRCRWNYHKGFTTRGGFEYHEYEPEPNLRTVVVFIHLETYSRAKYLLAEVPLTSQTFNNPDDILAVSTNTGYELTVKCLDGSKIMFYFSKETRETPMIPPSNPRFIEWKELVNVT